MTADLTADIALAAVTVLLAVFATWHLGGLPKGGGE